MNAFESLRSGLGGVTMPKPGPPLYPMPPASNEPAGYVDPKTYPAMVIHGEVVEKIAEGRCSCGEPIAIFQRREVATKSNQKDINDRVEGGWKVVWQSPSSCPSCVLAAQLASRHAHLGFRRLDRGIAREVISSTIAWRREQRTMMGQVEAEVLEDVLRAHPGPWAPRAALLGHPHAATIAQASVAGLTTTDHAKGGCGRWRTRS